VELRIALLKSASTFEHLAQTAEMDSVIQRRLAETEEQIANGEKQIAQQRRLIAELESNKSPASHAKYLLAGLELLANRSAG
jgi:phage protein D